MARKSYIHEPLTHPIEYRTLTQLHDFHTGLHPEAEAFVIYNYDGNRCSYTFQEVKNHSLKIAAILMHIGINRGQRVALMAPNCIEFVWCYLALNRIGANTMLIPAHGKTEEEVTAILQHLKCQALLVYPSGDESFDQNLIENVRNVLEEDKIILIGEEDVQVPCSFKTHHLSHLLKTNAQQLNLDEVYKQQEQVHYDDPAVVVFTSGSTGQPKAIQYTHHALVNDAILFMMHCVGMSNQQSVKNQCRFFNDRPFSWVGSLMAGFNSVFAMGFTFVAIPPTKSASKSDTEFFIRVLQDEKCTAALLLPYLIHDLITNPRAGHFDLSNLKCVISGGQAIPASLLTKLRVILPNCMFVNLYAMSELFPIAAKTIRPSDSFANLSYEGMKVCSPVEVKIVNDKKEIVSVGEKGEITVRSPFSFCEYLEDPKDDIKGMASSGWIHTDDAGYVDEHGGLHVCGRMHDVISRASSKIYPIEIEKVLATHPDVKAVVVIGVPDERLNEEICACVIPKTGSGLESSVSEFDQWASLQWKTDDFGLIRKQKYTLIMEAFPLTKTGKTDRKALKAIALQKLGNECIKK